VRAKGTRRLYAVETDPLHDVDRWLQPFRDYWGQRLDALAQNSPGAVANDASHS